MTVKTLGQIAWQAVSDISWQSLEAWQQKDYETMAQVVAAVVRAQCAQECADYAEEARSLLEHGEAAVAEHLEEAIRGLRW